MIPSMSLESDLAMPENPGRAILGKLRLVGLGKLRAGGLGSGGG